MGILGIFGQKGVQIYPQLAPGILAPLEPTTAIALDATLDQGHGHSSVITDFPVAAGTTIGDSVVRQPKRLTFNAILTNTPVQFFAGFRNSDDRAVQILNKLIRLHDEGAFCTVRTTIATRMDMVIENLSPTKDQDTGQAVGVSITFKEVRVVSTAFAESQFDTDAIQEGAQGTVDTGTQGLGAL